jgi:oxygen-independent coproporphyrinogen-3 oxidase
VQSLDDAALQFLGRGHSAGEARRAIAVAQTHFRRYSFDLIYARPGQTPQDWKRELAEALPLAAGHLSLYQLTIEENTAFAHAYRSGGFTLPDEETAEALYLATGEMLAAQGLMAYEVSNYARPGEESRHNLAYWRGDDYLGVGPGAHGRMSPDASAHSAASRIATATLKSPERWLSAVEAQGHGVETWQEVAGSDALAERLMMGLRLAEGIGYAEFAARTGADLRAWIGAEKIDRLTAQGLLAPDSEALRPTLRGRLVLNALLAHLAG